MTLADPTTAVLPQVSSGRPRRRRRRLAGFALVLAVATAGLFGGIRLFSANSSQAIAATPRSLPARVSALGRLAPEGEVVSVTSPTSTGPQSGSRLEQLLVHVGDEVQAGRVVAIIDTNRSRVAAVAVAKATVEVANAKLAQVKAGPKPEDVTAQEAVVRRSEAGLVAAQEDFDRGSRVVKSKAMSLEELTARQMRLDQARAELAQQKAHLAAIKVIRSVDVKAAQADVDQAEAALTVADEDLRNTEVRAPFNGRVLRIDTHPGERVGDAGIMELGDTDHMQVVAEVYEEDVGKVRVGQPATIQVETLGLALSGTVVGKDLVVSRKVIFSNDPVADIDARVVEVRIRLSPEDVGKVAGLSKARTDVVIDVSGEAK